MFHSVASAARPAAAGRRHGNQRVGTDLAHVRPRSQGADDGLGGGHREPVEDPERDHPPHVAEGLLPKQMGANRPLSQIGQLLKGIPHRVEPRRARVARVEGRGRAGVRLIGHLDDDRERVPWRQRAQLRVHRGVEPAGPGRAGPEQDGKTDGSGQTSSIHGFPPRYGSRRMWTGPWKRGRRMM